MRCFILSSGKEIGIMCEREGNNTGVGLDFGVELKGTRT